jgi:hypothetical protein
MSKRKFVTFIGMILAVAVFAWAPGDALAKRGDKDKTKTKKQVTINDVAKYLGKVTPAEQKAAAESARQLGLKPGVAGRAAQAPGPGGAQ